jgi:hypothetical protein
MIPAIHTPKQLRDAINRIKFEQNLTQRVTTLEHCLVRVGIFIQAKQITAQEGQILRGIVNTMLAQAKEMQKCPDTSNTVIVNGKPLEESTLETDSVQVNSPKMEASEDTSLNTLALTEQDEPYTPSLQKMDPLTYQPKRRKSRKKGGSLPSQEVGDSDSDESETDDSQLGDCR